MNASVAGAQSGSGPVPEARPASAWALGLLPLIGLIALLFATNLLLHFPGKMNSDSNNQYAEAVARSYTDWHPPVMAWVWSRLRLLADGPAPFLVLHLTAYWCGFGLLADAIRRLGHSKTAIAFALAGAFPPFLYVNAFIMKDVGMVAAWLPAVGLLFWFRSQQLKIPVLAGVLIAALLVYGTLVRSNAIFAIGPLLVYALASPAWLRSLRLMLAACVIAVLAVPVSQVANRVLFDAAPRNAVQSLFLFDLMGIAVVEKKPALMLPRANITMDDLKNCYSPYWWDTLSPWGKCASRVYRPDPTFVAWGEGLPTQWVETIAAHPVAYAIHRLKHFNSSLHFVVPLKHSRLVPDYQPNDPAFKALEVFTERDIKFDLLRKSPLLTPATWLVWGVVLLVLVAPCEESSRIGLARVLIVSALGYSCAYLLIGVATDMRYHYWSIIAILLATLLLLPQLGSGLRNRSKTLIVGLAAVGVVVAIGTWSRVTDFQAFVV